MKPQDAPATGLGPPSGSPSQVCPVGRFRTKPSPGRAGSAARPSRTRTPPQSSPGIPGWAPTAPGFSIQANRLLCEPAGHPAGTNRSESHPTRMGGAGRPPAPGLFRGGPAPSTTGRHGTTRAQHRRNAFRTAGLLHHPPHLSKPPSRPRPASFGLRASPQRPAVQLQFHLHHPVHPFSPPFDSPPSWRRGWDKYRPRVKKSGAG